MTDPAAGPVTHRRVLAIAFPIVLSNATIPIIGAVDTAVVGQLGLAAPIGAVGLGAVIISTLYWIYSFLRMGTTGLVAQSRGAGDAPETGALLMRALLIGLAGGAVYVLLQWPLTALAFRIAPASDEVEGLTQTYLSIRIWGAPAAIAIYAVNGWLIGMERTRAVLLLQLWMNGLNVALDLWFVLGLGWGVGGVAAATVIAEVSALGFGLWLCRDAFAGAQWQNWARVFDRARLRRMMAVNSDILLRSLLLQVSFTSFLFLGADLGDLTLAANQVLLQFVQFMAYALDGFAFAAEALVGTALGARDPARLRRAALVASGWGVGLSVPLGLGLFAAGPWIIDLMAKAPEVQAEARLYLPWLLVAPIGGAAAWMLDGIFIGATRTRAMLHAMVVAVAIYAAAVALLLPIFGNHGLWAALMVLNLARAATLALRYPALERAAAGHRP